MFVSFGCCKGTCLFLLLLCSQFLSLLIVVSLRWRRIADVQEEHSPLYIFI